MAQSSAYRGASSLFTSYKNSTCHCRNVLAIVEMLAAGMPLSGADPAAPILSHSADINYYHYPRGVHSPTGSPVFPSELQIMFSIV